MDRDKLTQRRAELIKTIEAIDGVIRSRDWQVLREGFEDRVESLDRQLLVEAKKPVLEMGKIHFIQGQISEAKLLDLATWQDKLKKELEGIKINLQ